MPGRGPERLTGSNNNAVTDPPSGLLKEMALTSTPLSVDSTAFCRFSGALTGSAVAAPPKSGRATVQESATGLGPVEAAVGGSPPHAVPRTLDAWAYRTGVRLRFIRPGKPIENASVESFNGKFRDECLNEHWFVNLADAKTAIEAWRIDYNSIRPHSSLDGATPDHFATTTEGARRLPPGRLREEPNPEDPSLSA